jgi:hypothetical protein
MLEELIIDHTDYLGQALQTVLTQTEENIGGDSIDCDYENEICPNERTATSTSSYDDVS